MFTRFKTAAIECLQMFDVLVDPGAAAGRIERRASWVLPLALVGAGSILLGFAILPLTLRVVDQNLPVGIPEDQLQRSLSTAVTVQRIGIALSPVSLIVKWGMGAGILYMSCVILDLRVTFKRLFALLAQCSLIPFLQDMTAFTIIRFRGHSIQKITDLAPAMGLDIFIRDLSKPLMAVVSYFSAFNLWYIVVLSIGLSAISGCTKKKAFLATVPNWLLPLGITMGIAALTL